MKIYLTGFEPFGDHAINASWEAVKGFPWNDPRATLEREQLPVDYRALHKYLPTRLNEINPDVILHLGVMSARGFLRLEQRAKNQIGQTLDNAGYRPEDPEIEVAGPDFHQSSFPIPLILERLNERGLPARGSEDAGSYLCNFSYYLSLNWGKTRKVAVAFLHVPVLGEPFSVEQLRDVIHVVLESAIEARDGT